MSTLMRRVDSPKKPAPTDWHPADIKAALERRGWSLRRLSTRHDYQPGSLRYALRLAWPRAEKIIAKAIGVTPQEIWPSRYRADGEPRSARGERGLGRRPKNSTAPRGRNVDLKVAA